MLEAFVSRSEVRERVAFGASWAISKALPSILPAQVTAKKPVDDWSTQPATLRVGRRTAA